MSPAPSAGARGGSERRGEPDEHPTGPSRSWGPPRDAEQLVFPEPPAGRGRHAASDTIIPFAPRRRRWVRAASVVTSAAAVLAVLAGLGAWNVRLRSDQQQLQESLARQSSIVAQRDAAIRELTANEPARVAALAGGPDQPRKATVVVRGDRVEIIIEGLGPSEADARYWLWTLNCDDPANPRDLKPIRGFRIAQPEFSIRDVGSDPGFASAPCFAISSERGTATPVSPRVVEAIGRPA